MCSNIAASLIFSIQYLRNQNLTFFSAKPGKTLLAALHSDNFSNKIQTQLIQKVTARINKIELTEEKMQKTARERRIRQPCEELHMPQKSQTENCTCTIQQTAMQVYYIYTKNSPQNLVKRFWRHCIQTTFRPKSKHNGSKRLLPE